MNSSRIDHSNTDILKVRRAIKLMLRNWHLYLASLVIIVGCAYFYLGHKFPIYSAQASILIEEVEAAPAMDMLEGFAVRPGVQNLDNQILIMSSYVTVREVVEELPFEIDVYRKGFLSKASYYPLSPVRIEPGSKGLPYNVEFVFQYIGDETFKLSISSKSEIELDTVFTFGKEFFLKNGSFMIYPVLELEDVYKTGDKIFFQFYDKDRLTENFVRRLLVENATREGSIVRLSLEGTNRIKDVIFLEKLTEVFIENNLEKKNLEANRIIGFIEELLVDVSDSLTLTETQLQEFRSKNRIMDVSAQTRQIIDQAVLFENEKARLNLQKKYYLYLNDYLDDADNTNRPVAPASMGIEDPLLASSLLELSGLQAEYFSSGVGERNPLQGQLEMRIRNTKRRIKETLSGIILANGMAINENEKQINRLNVEASRLPEKEQKLLGFERRFNLNNVLYTFLLQRRAEAQIQKASNAPDHQLMDPPRSKGPVSPVPRNVYAFAISLALLIPTLILLLFSNVLQVKISSEEDLSLISSLPVIAQFPHSRLSYYTIVLTDPNSSMAEAFRSLRTRMEFFTKEVECPVILVSSSIPGEGKTFASINLASAYSLMGKKTLLIGFDLRRPTLAKSFETKSKNGITDYLIGKSKLDDVIFETEYENLHIIPSGPIPPNPAELLSLVKAKEIFAILRRKYDYIIVDSAPVGVVSDIYPVASVVDTMLMVVRHGHTRKNALRATLSDLEDYKINGLGLLI
ncbi:polysaccharide biosynthesis tyrosine autokinase, partial [bacterium]|nr:polysaccharide biosynthesis tyrosine autokinase [bacterium]